MKKIIFTMVVILSFSFNLFAQKANSIDSEKPYNFPVQEMFNNNNINFKEHQILKSKKLKLQGTLFLIDTIKAYIDTNGISLYTYTYDENGNMITYLRKDFKDTSWSNVVNYFYKYDGKGNLIKEDYYIWEYVSWVPYGFYKYDYDNNNNLTSVYYYVWKYGSWEYESHESYFYDINGKIIKKEIQGSNGRKLVNKLQCIYSYDSGDNLDYVLWKKWINSAWENYFHYLYIFDNKGNISTELHEKYINGNWQCQKKYSFTYDNLGRIITKRVDELDTIANQLICNFTYIYEYKIDSRTELCQKRIDSQLVNYSLNTYKYDSYGNLLSDICEYWNYDSWTILKRITHTYDSDGNPLTKHSEILESKEWKDFNEYFSFYDYKGNIYNLSCTKLEIKWSSITHFEENQLKSIALLNYPNPFSTTTTIKYTLKQPGYVILNIYNSLGIEVAGLVNEFKNAGEHFVVFESGNMPEGVYFYRMQAGEYNESGKILLSK